MDSTWAGRITTNLSHRRENPHMKRRGARQSAEGQNEQGNGDTADSPDIVSQFHLRVGVHGLEKVPTDGREKIPAGGHVRVPTHCVSIRGPGLLLLAGRRGAGPQDSSGDRAPGVDRGGFLN